MQPLGQRHREGIGTLGHRAENDGLCVGKFRHGDLGALMAANKAVKVEKAIWRIGMLGASCGHQDRDPAKGAGNSCQSVTRRPHRS